MGKVLTFLGASLALALVVPSQAQNAPDMFKDLDTSHWAYAATESLRSKGIVIGYPDGYFRGKRTLTRYEFAVALDRALKTIKPAEGQKGEPGPKGEQGERGERGEVGPPGMTPEEVAKLRALAEEFRKELAKLGNDMNAVNRKLDALAKDVADIKATLAGMPKISGAAVFAFRSDNVNGGYVDKDGIVNPLKNQQYVVHALELNVAANVKGGATVKASVDVDNYLNSRPNTFGQSIGFQGPVAPGGPALSSSVPADVRLRSLEINTPFNGLGRGSSLTLGRFGMRISHMTWWKPDFDTYINNPLVDDGMYYGDGAKLTTKFGSLDFNVFGQQLSSNQGTTGFAVNTPLAGVSTLVGEGGPIFGAAVFRGGQKPIAQPYQGQMNVDQMLGVTAGLNVHALHGARLNLTAIDAAQTQGTPTGAAIGFNGVEILGADTNVKLTDKVTLSVDWAKSITHTGRFSTVNAHQNNAGNAIVGFNVGKVNLAAGYKYVDPLFYAPGYWGRIGNWLNPTNIQGPTVRAGYDFSKSLGVNIGADWYTPARNRAGSGGIGGDDEITRILAGLRFGLSKNFTITADWEGVGYTLVGAHSGIPGSVNGSTVHPTEQYLTLGTGYHLTDATMLRLAYQIGDFNGHGLLSEGGTGTRNTFGVFTAQAAVKF